MSKPIAIQRTQKEKEERKLYWSSIIRQLLQHGRQKRSHSLPIKRLKTNDDSNNNIAGFQPTYSYRIGGWDD